MLEGATIQVNDLKMINLIEKLVGLDVVLPHEHSVDLILPSLHSSYEVLVVNFNVNKTDVPLEELINMFKINKSTIKKEKSILQEE